MSIKPFQPLVAAVTDAPLLTLLHPRRSTRPLLVLLALGLALGGILIAQVGMPIWGATTIVISMLLLPAVQKWRDDLARWGVPMMILSILLTLQGFHTVEHIAQWVEYHVFGWQPKASSGLISAANVEWVHFAWNWSVLLIIGYLMTVGRMRNIWAWALLLWASAHTLEHTYLFIRYLETVRLLAAQGVSESFAQGLPGVLGRDGWLSTISAQESGLALVCRLAPPLITAIRLDVHFWWNIGETTLLLAAAHTYVRRQWSAHR